MLPHRSKDNFNGVEGKGKEGNDVIHSLNHEGWAGTHRSGLGSMYIPEHIIYWPKGHVLSSAEQMLGFLTRQPFHFCVYNQEMVFFAHTQKIGRAKWYFITSLNTQTFSSP